MNHLTQSFKKFELKKKLLRNDPYILKFQNFKSKVGNKLSSGNYPYIMKFLIFKTKVENELTLGELSIYNEISNFQN